MTSRPESTNKEGPSVDAPGPSILRHFKAAVDDTETDRRAPRSGQDVRPWVAVTRDYDDHPVFAREAMTEREAFQTMFRRYARAFDDEARGLKRGQFVCSYPELARRWNNGAHVFDRNGRKSEAWSKDRARKFCQRLKAENMLGIELLPDRSIRFTITNFDRYQTANCQTRARREPDASQTRENSNAAKTYGTPDASQTRARREPDAYRETTSSDTQLEPQWFEPPPPNAADYPEADDALPRCPVEEEGDTGGQVSEVEWHRAKVDAISTDPADPWVRFRGVPSETFREQLKGTGFQYVSRTRTWEVSSPDAAKACMDVLRALADEPPKPKVAGKPEQPEATPPPTLAPDASAAESWRDVDADMRNVIDAELYDRHFSGLAPVSVEDGVMTLAHPNEMTAILMNKSYRDLIARCVERATGQRLRVEVIAGVVVATDESR